LGKSGGGHQTRQEIDVVGDTHDAVLGQRAAAYDASALFSIRVPHDELGDHRIVEGTDLVVFLDAGVDPDVKVFFRRREV
jgi:hypothetical protein